MLFFILKNIYIYKDFSYNKNGNSSFNNRPTINFKVYIISPYPAGYMKCLLKGRIRLFKGKLKLAAVLFFSCVCVLFILLLEYYLRQTNQFHMQQMLAIQHIQSDIDKLNAIQRELDDWDSSFYDAAFGLAPAENGTATLERSERILHYAASLSECGMLNASSAALLKSAVSQARKATAIQPSMGGGKDMQKAYLNEFIPALQKMQTLMRSMLPGDHAVPPPVSFLIKRLLGVTGFALAVLTAGFIGLSRLFGNKRKEANR